MPDAANYRPSGDNSVLRSVLFEVWGGRCYWCKQPKDFTETQIDHIVPQSLPSALLQELMRALALPLDFDVHEPYNLALICGACNREKSDEDLTLTPIVLSRLRRAQRLASKVRTRVYNFSASGDLAKALIFAAQVPLYEPAARAALEDHGPAVVQRLAWLNEERVDFTTSRDMQLSLGAEQPIEVGVYLDAEGRRAVMILEDVCGVDLESLLQESLSEIYAKLQTEVGIAFEAIEGSSSQTNSGPPVSHYLRFEINTVTFERSLRSLQFGFEGDVEASLSASLVQSSEDGYGLRDFQGDAVVAGRFAFEVYWDPTDGELGVSEQWPELDIEVSTSG